MHQEQLQTDHCRELRWPNTVLKYTGVSKCYLETTFFWVPEIGVVQDQLKRNEF